MVAKLTSLAADTLVAPVRHHVGRSRNGGSVIFPPIAGWTSLTFFLADVQTGFGPFIAVYLTEHKWTAAQIGAVLGIGSITAMAAQIPAGAAIDASPLKRGATLVGLLAVMASAMLLALFPAHWPVVGAEVLHGIASCVLVPAVAAVTLTRVGRAAFSRRLGRNARCTALGNGIGAVLMGFAGARIAASAPFWLAALFCVPAILALLALPPRHESEPRKKRLPVRDVASETRRVLTDRRLLAFILCVVLFFVGNGFLLPLAMNRLGNRISAQNTNEQLAACLLVAQAMVALISPWMGRKADEWGRRRVGRGDVRRAAAAGGGRHHQRHQPLQSGAGRAGAGRRTRDERRAIRRAFFGHPSRIFCRIRHSGRGRCAGGRGGVAAAAGDQGRRSRRAEKRERQAETGKDGVLAGSGRDDFVDPSS